DGGSCDLDGVPVFAPNFAKMRTAISPKRREATMARQEFLANLHVAKNLFKHANSPTPNGDLDPQALQGKMARAAIWLTPHSVRGFCEDDFAELGPARQRELADAVREFLEVAKQVPPAQPPTPEQITKGKEAFE